MNETDDQPIDMLVEMHETVHREYPFPGAVTTADVDHAEAAGLDVYYHGGMGEDQCSSYNRFTVFLTRAPYEKLVILQRMWDNERNRQRAQ